MVEQPDASPAVAAAPPAPDRISLVTPWFPTLEKPQGGAFVQAQAAALHDVLGSRVDVVHLDDWILPPGRLARRRVRRAVDELSTGSRRVEPRAAPYGTHLRCPVPVGSWGGFAGAARAHARTLSRLLDGRRLSGVVQAHVGLPGGWAAVENAAPDARVFVTEHATFLDAVFAQPEAAELYGRMLERCERLLCVSELLRREVVARFPHTAETVVVVPNPVAFADVPLRSRDRYPLRRWLYVGAFIPRKGVARLVEAFAIVRDVLGHDVTLTLLGDGPDRGTLDARVGELGLSDAVTFADPVEPGEVPGFYAEHDLLVHPSEYETFGMTLVEAIAVGTPVLVTRCGGPEETLRGIEELVGALVPVGEGPVEIVRGYLELLDRAERLDVPAGRRILESRYSETAVARRLAALYAGDAPAPLIPPTGGG